MSKTSSLQPKQSELSAPFGGYLGKFKAHLRQHALAWEITVILVLKLVVIMAIKDSYFSEPVPKVQVKQEMQQLWSNEQGLPEQLNTPPITN